jgi:anti-anti-sigma factor
MPTFAREMRDDLNVLVVTGELDIYAQAEFADALHSLDATAPRILLDFCRCSYFDSSALTELVRFRNARHKTQQVLLAVPNPNGQRILQIAGLHNAFEFAACPHRHAIPLDRKARNVISVAS